MEVSSRSKSAVIIMGVLLAILGVLMLMFPVSSTVFMVYVFGWALVFGAIATCVNHFRTPDELRRGSDLVLAVFELIFGLAVLVWPGLFLTYLFVFVGVLVVANGIGDIIEAFSLRKVPGAAWGLWLVLGILTVIFGVVVFASPVISAVLIEVLAAWALIFAGISEIVYGASMPAAK